MKRGIVVFVAFVIMAHIALAIPSRPRYDPLALSIPSRTQQARITNPGAVYDLINRNTGKQTLDWPNEDLRQVAGSNSWGDWRPMRGDVGEVIAVCRHPFLPIRVYVLKIGKYYAPMGEEGIELLTP